MTKEEVVKQCNTLIDKLEDLMNSAEELVKEVRGVVRAAEYLPGEVDDINDKEDE